MDVAPSHGENRGSIPLGSATGAFFINVGSIHPMVGCRDPATPAGPLSFGEAFPSAVSKPCSLRLARVARSARGAAVACLRPSGRATFTA